MNHAIDHLEEEYKTLEGVTPWGRPLRIAGLVLLVAAIGAIVWFVNSPPPITSGH
jgi:hypothetical protein